MLHPIDKSPVRQQIAEIIQSVLAPERVSWRQLLVLETELHPDCRPWAIVMIQDAVQHSIITRFRNRQDADDHLRRISLSSDNFESFAIEYEGMTQGLMAVETQWHRSQVNRRNRVVYIQAIASAPWNRGSIQRPPELRGVGTALLLFARQRSLELGYEGRVGLHALPRAESFYDDQNMANYGHDPDNENLTYFEYGLFRR